MLIPIILSKFPSDIRLRVARESGDDTWDIDELLKIIRLEVEAREASESTHVSMQRLPTNNFRGLSNPHPTASSLLTSGNNGIHCAYCNASHFSASCTKVVTLGERREVLKKSGRCFNCLRSGHKSKNCDSQKNCRYCHRRHHQSLCEHCPSLKREASPPEKSPEPKSVTTNTSSQANHRQVVLLQTAQVEAVGEYDVIPVRILLDNGSQLSYVTVSLKSRLKLKPVRQERLSLNTFGSDSFTTKGCDLVRVTLQRPGYNKSLEIMARTSPVICSSLPALVSVNKYSYLRNLDLADSGKLQRSGIDILIGSDYYWQVVTGDIVNGNGGPVAMSSIFGWLLSGPVSHPITGSNFHSLVVIGKDERASKNDCVIQILRRFWDNEAIGIHEITEESEQPIQFLSDIQFNGIRYEVRLPWKEGYPSSDIPDHFRLCFNRLKYLQLRLLKTPHVLQEYNEIIREELNRGIIEIVDNIKDDADHIHYLPHHPVIRQDKQTTKVRVVYDGSARSAEDHLSINNCLLTGPNLIPKLFDILIRFCWYRIAITADIEKAFLMIAIHQQDRDMLRFLWFKDPTKVDSQISHFRFNRLVFGLRPSPAILGSVISHHLEKYRQQYPELVESIKDSLYVDDLIAGVDDIKQGFDLYKKAREIMAAGSFNLRKWKSNSAELWRKIQEFNRGESTKSTVNQSTPETALDCTLIGLDKSHAESESTRLLGVMWNNIFDEFLFCFSELSEYAQGLPVSKRSILKVSAKIFDPLGLLSPFVIKLKVLFQTLCTESVDWDEPLKGKALEQWNRFRWEIKALNQIKIPRCYFLSSLSPIQVQLHGFSDASEKAFAAAIYLRAAYSDGTVTTRLVAAKTRVAPMKKQSIPRLELLGALILARLANAILTAMAREIAIVYWVDLMTTLFWIKGDKPWKQYVANRVREIHQLTNKDHWRHVQDN